MIFSDYFVASMTRNSNALRCTKKRWNVLHLAGLIVSWLGANAVVPAAIAQETPPSVEELQQDLDALQSEVDKTLEELKAKEADLYQQLGAIVAEAGAGQLISTASDRSSVCRTLTNQLISNMPAQRPELYLSGKATLNIPPADQKTLGECFTQNDGMSILLYTLYRVSNQDTLGDVSALWAYDNLLKAGTLGEMAALEATTFYAERTKTDSTFATQLFSAERVKPLFELMDRYKIDRTALESAVKTQHEVDQSIRQSQTQCRDLRNSVSPQSRDAFRNDIATRFPDLPGICADVGIDLFAFGGVPNDATWAPFLTEFHFTSGGREYKARDVSVLYDDWQKVLANSDAVWNYAHPDFILFKDDSGRHFLAGFDANLDVRGDQRTYIFRIVSMDVDWFKQSYDHIAKAVKAGPAGGNENAQEREQAKRLTAHEPAFQFMVDHYAGDYRSSQGVVNDIINHRALDRTMPFHEVRAMLDKELAKY